jgi:hypothetical protein
MNVLGCITRAALAVDALAIAFLTFAWPALWPEGRDDPVYRIAAITAMWTFFAALAAILFDKVCRAPRT